ncbi:MAG: hypothetical protein HOL85_21920 [Rhodospirillaceae bacterium]|nr:hypothetical protein [Rhodospirillaceae bacterium]
MFSLNKIFILGMILVAVWYGFKMIGRLDRARKRKVRDEAREQGGAQGGAQGQQQPRDQGHAEPRGPSKDDGVIDLIQSEDGSYIQGKHDDRV